MTSCNKIYKKETFENCNLEKLFENNKKITFIACTFINCFHSAGTGINYDIELRFSTNCKFTGKWEHILCNKITYSKCEFDEFTYFNIDKEKHVSEDLTLFDCTFNSIDCEGIIFIKPFIQIVDENKLKHIDNIKLTRCEFKDDFILNATDRNDERKLHEIKLDSIDLSHSIFHKKFKMQNCIVNNAAKFYNTSFKDLADFYKTKFNKIDFEKTNFEDISIFTEATFYKNISFKYTTFLKLALFRKTVFEETLDLEDSVIKDESNFLGMSAKMANRETARIIKHSFEKQNNIIEANKFYVLEMNEREKELSKDKKSNFSDWFIFKLHKTSSYYSQSWSRALFWIVLLSVLYTFEQNGIPTMTLFLYFFIITMSLLYFTKKSTIATNIIEKLGSIIFSLMLIYFADYEIFKAIIIVSFDNGYIINETIKNIYPLSNLSIDKMTASIFIYKIVISYLIYQFIVSVRQNTRRK